MSIRSLAQKAVLLWSKGFAKKQVTRVSSVCFQYVIDKIRVLYGQIRANEANDRKKKLTGKNLPNTPFDRKSVVGRGSKAVTGKLSGMVPHLLGWHLTGWCDRWGMTHVGNETEDSLKVHVMCTFNFSFSVCVYLGVDQYSVRPQNNMANFPPFCGT